MDTFHPVGTSNPWRRFLIEGAPESISALLADVERRLKERKFLRDPVIEQQQAWQSALHNASFCFVGEPRGIPVLLSLIRVSERRIRGSTCGLLEAASRVLPQEVAAVVAEVMDTILLPSANRCGLKVMAPRLGPRSLVQTRTLAALQSFCDLAAESKPDDLAPRAEAAWRHFLITAGQEDIAFDIEELTNWFVASGWERVEAERLVERFMREATLLAEYAEAIRG